MKAIAIACLLLAGSFCLRAAAAATLTFSSFGAGGSNTGYGDCVAGANNPGCYQSPSSEWIAAPFVPAVSGALDYIDVGAKYLNGTQGVVVWLVDDNGGSPKAITPVLETIDAATLPASNTADPKVKLKSKHNPQLTAGTTYWLIMAPTTYDGLNSWLLSTDTTAPDVSNDGGNTWYAYGSSPPYTNLPAFDVYVK